MSDAYCLFGYPVHHSWSPFIHGLFARQTGQDMEYRLQESSPENFRREALAFFFDKGGRGCNVTLPHKLAAAELVNHLSPRAQLADAVNTIVRRDGELLGDNTDGIGLVTDLLQNLKLELRAPRILMLGAGGAARGALGPLLERLEPSEIVIANRTLERATELALHFARLGPLSAVSFAALKGAQVFDLVINATSASLRGTVPPVPPSLIGPRTACYDMAYGIGETSFTRWAREAGAPVAAQGWGMLVEQAAESFALWRGVRPSTPPVLQALQERAAATAVQA
ncbi:MAG: shikimate dehydrogenase [Steroidobacteraceae bacterium]